MTGGYYSDPFVRSRMLEFLGGPGPDQATAVYVDEGRVGPAESWSVRPVAEVWECLDQGLDISRSLWDRQHLLFHLDLEYANLDYPAEPYLDPTRSFDIQKPVVEAVYEFLGESGIVPLHILSGRGHHFVWQISRGSRAFLELRRLGDRASGLSEYYGRFTGPAGEIVDRGLEEAFTAQGKVMEFLAAEIQRRSAEACAVPVMVTELATGPVERGREMVSIDISEYGDPLYARKTRLPFSLYTKPQQSEAALGPHAVSQIPALFAVPSSRHGWVEGVKSMRNPADALELARSSRTSIPVQNQGTLGIIERYLVSELASVHAWFEEQTAHPPENWPETYDQTPLEELPPCARHPLDRPNDRLLDLSGIQLVTRVMLALGWHPRHVAGLVRSRYERDFGWGNRWDLYSPGHRADFYVRLFTGLILTGRDELVDFNCVSCKEKGQCIQPEQGCAMDEFRESLKERRNHERMACRPFNRLFLP